MLLWDEQVNWRKKERRYALRSNVSRSLRGSYRSGGWWRELKGRWGNLSFEDIDVDQYKEAATGLSANR